MRKKLIGGLAAATLLLAAPAWAGGPPHGHAYGHWKHGNHWNQHYAHSHYVVRERYVVREVARPVPVYPRAVYPAYPVYPVAAPGIHVVFPNLFVPFY